MILSVVFGVIHWAGRPGRSPYEVAFSDTLVCSISSDNDPDLILSVDTGKPMVCAANPYAYPIPQDHDFGVFTEDDVDEITAISEALARDGHLSAEDKQVIQRKAQAVGVLDEYRHPKPRYTATGPLAIICLIGASVLWSVGWFSLREA